MKVPAAAVALVALVPAQTPVQLGVAPLVAVVEAVDEGRPEVDVGARMSSYQDLH